MSHNQSECAAQIRDQGFRVTPQRMLLLDAVCEANGHTTFDEVYERVKTKAPGINPATVYRTLDFLCDLRLVVSAEIDGKTVYEIAEETPHHHLVCRRCGSIQKLTDYHFHDLRAHLLAEHGFQADLDHVAITGLCAQCTENESHAS
jgi:Fur family ferric uptake transcriptional regulator